MKIRFFPPAGLQPIRHQKSDFQMPSALCAVPPQDAFVPSAHFGTSGLKRSDILRMLPSDPEIEQRLALGKAEEQLAREKQEQMTALTQAIADQQPLKTIKACLKQVSDLNGEDPKGYTPLIQAIQMKRYDVVKLLLDRGVDVEHSSQSYTPLAWAILAGNLPIIKLLLSRNANPEVVKINGVPLILMAASFNDLKLAKCLLDKKVNVNERGDRYDSCRSRNLWESTPVITAIQNNDRDMLKLLLKYQPDLQQTDGRGLSPLMWAIISDNVPFARRLLKAGADVNEVSRYPTTHPVTYRNIGPITPLMAAVEKNNLQMLKLLLSYHPTNLQEKNVHGKTVFEMAARKDNPEIIEALASLQPKAIVLSFRLRETSS